MDYRSMVRNILLSWNTQFEEIKGGRFTIQLNQYRVMAIGFIGDSIHMGIMEPGVYAYLDRRKATLMGRKAAASHNVKYEQSEKQPVFSIYIKPDNSDEEELSGALEECKIDLEAAMDDFGKMVFRSK